MASKLWPGAGETHIGKGRVIASTDIEAALGQVGVAPDFAFTGGGADSNIPFVHRLTADGDNYFLVNRLNHSETIAAHFRVTGKAPELWHAETGTAEPVSYRIANGETVVPLRLGPEESVHVVFRKPAIADTLTIVAPAMVVLGPRIRYFSGVATYTKDFAAPDAWKPGRALWLDLGDVHELAEVSVNGKVASTAWHAPFHVDIGGLTQRGRNHLQIRVANLWINRLIGDAQPGARKVTWTALPTYRADAPLHPSGLIGPVRLLGQNPEKPLPPDLILTGAFFELECGSDNKSHGMFLQATYQLATPAWRASLPTMTDRLTEPGKPCRLITSAIRQCPTRSA